MILQEIAVKTRARIDREKEIHTLREVRASALAMSSNTGYPFFTALKKEGLSYICEVKKASPSKGIIAEDFPYVEIAKEYEEAGASAVSVLTEPYYFKGSDAYLTEISKKISIPIIRKDFTIDEHQIYTAKLIGACAILLICSLLSAEEIKYYLELARSLGLSALVEAHDEEEIETALKAGARIVGVNNRDLKTFKVDISNCLRLRSLVPRDCVFVAESGIKTPEDIAKLKDASVDAVLIGQTLMQAKDKKTALRELNGGEL